MSGLPSVYDSILVDSSKAWYSLVDLQDSKRILNDKIKQLTLSFKPLSFEPYDVYAERHWNDYEVDQLTCSSESEIGSNIEHGLIAAPKKQKETLKLVKNKSKITDVIIPDDSESNDNSDNEPLSHRRSRLKSVPKLSGVKKKKKQQINAQNKKANFKEKNVQPYNNYIEEHRRRSTRLIMRNMNEDKRIHVSGRRIKLLKGPKLLERKVPIVRRPYRKSDWLLRHKYRFVPEADVPIIPVNAHVSFDMLMSTTQMQDVLQYFGDEYGQVPIIQREHVQMVEPGESDEESEEEEENSDEEMDPTR